ncbi:PDF receptor [Scaptodrosophila lebanonensis]|uniref:PDF receptor n=1 Tax=Drosophila lebanonensis TaxID=7225 RepID=A0A6J2TSS2_DROLE|nr:PDF receptor [Scaptodrosophila lebanonensis]
MTDLNSLLRRNRGESIEGDGGTDSTRLTIASYIGKATTAAASISVPHGSSSNSSSSSSKLSATIASIYNYLPRSSTTPQSAAVATTRSPMHFINRATHLKNTAMSTLKSSIAATTTTTAAATGATATAAATSALPTAINMTWNTTTTTTPAMTAAWTAASTAGSYENCSALFANYTQPQAGLYCNWTWDTLLCWPPTPAGVLARMNCPSGWHGVDTRKFANRKCELDGHWGGRPNETDPNHMGWTDYGPCYTPEVTQLMQQINADFDVYLDIAKRTRTLEIVGLCLSLLALIVSLIIFCNFRSLRNNRTKIHKNLFIAMVLQVIVRLTLYLDQAFKRGRQEAATNTSLSGIENTPYLCEASYVLLEYARTAMFMWMFIEGLYLHNMVTVAVFQGSFPHRFFSVLGWGMPVLMTTVWALCTVIYMDTALGDCMWNYNLTPYYWILEGPRLVVILLNFIFLVNIIRVLVVKLRQSQASDIEQTRKAVRAAIVLLPLLGITNLLYLVPDLKTAWKFALWSYGTHFLTSFQGFFIALIYCFLNGEVRAVLLKSLAVYMSVRGHSEWVPKRTSMYSAAYNTAPDTDALQQPGDSLPGGKRVSPPNKRVNYRKGSCASIVVTHDHTAQRQRLVQRNNNNGNASPRPRTLDTTPPDVAVTSVSATRIHSKDTTAGTSPSAGSSWMIILCFRGQKVLRVPPASSVPPESVVFELSEQ